MMCRSIPHPAAPCDTTSSHVRMDQDRRAAAGDRAADAVAGDVHRAAPPVRGQMRAARRARGGGARAEPGPPDRCPRAPMPAPARRPVPSEPGAALHDGGRAPGRERVLSGSARTRSTPTGCFPPCCRCGLFPEFTGTSIRAEVAHGRSRFDFQVGGVMIEVKSVTLTRTAFGVVGAFPDAVSARAARHCDELAALCRSGNPTRHRLRGAARRHRVGGAGRRCGPGVRDRDSARGGGGCDGAGVRAGDRPGRRLARPEGAGHPLNSERDSGLPTLRPRVLSGPLPSVLG